MKKQKNCKYCNELFTSRRRNHIYCSSSCKTMASYKRNNYKYVAGHYQRDKIVKKENLSAPANQKTEKPIPTHDVYAQKTNGVNVSSVTNSALGSLAASTAINGAKRIFAPNSLPATKGDVEKLKREINELKTLLKSKNQSWMF